MRRGVAAPTPRTTERIILLLLPSALAPSGCGDFKIWENGRLQDAVASVGGGVMIDLGPMPLNFYLSHILDSAALDSFRFPDGSTPYDGIRFDFYIGPRF